MAIQLGARAPTGSRRILLMTIAAVAIILVVYPLLQNRLPSRFVLSDPLAQSRRPPATTPPEPDTQPPPQIPQGGSQASPYSPPEVAPVDHADRPSVPQAPPEPKPKQHKGPRRKAAVFATIKRRPIEWMKNITSDWEIYNYVSDDPHAKYKVPYEGGREAMVYLTYIIDNYKDLADIVVFAHGHDRAWHQPEPFTFILQALNLDAVEEHGWVNLRCTLNPSCIPAPGTWVKTQYAPPGEKWWSYLTRGLFSHVYRPGDPWYNESIPELNGMRIPPLWGSPCCAQFAVSKAAIVSKPLEFWKRVREPVMGKPERLTAKWWPGARKERNEGINAWNIGVAYERTWHYFFGKEAITCLDEDYCRKVIYQDRIHCNGQTSTWEKSQNFQWITCSLKE